MDRPTSRYPVTTWITSALVTVALAVAVRLGAALADVEVLVPDRAGGDPTPLTLEPLVAVIVGVHLAAVLAVLVLDRLLHGRSRRVLRIVGYLLLIASLAPVVLGDLPTDSTVVLAVLHLLVGGAVLRTVIRE